MPIDPNPFGYEFNILEVDELVKRQAQKEVQIEPVNGVIERFETLQKVSSKMTECILKYKDKFVWSDKAMVLLQGIYIRCCNLEDYKTKVNKFWINHGDLDLDVTIPKLGYVEYDSSNYAYLTIVPVRMNRFGINNHNLKVSIEVPLSSYGYTEDIHPKDLLTKNTAGIVNCLYNNYISYEMAYDSLSKKNTSRAPHREFCLIRDISNNIFLSWKNTIIGVMLDKFTLSICRSLNSKKFIAYTQSCLTDKLKVVCYE